ncbi:hypothetical protein F1C10_05470 [Sphingomonas sp. NBWT7]|uniref:hypothetical protein n=1 Tax=Sphingomonas sp. NBWT7 TaxID=2596913 RepID=UPI0016295629|nr:hypothetical protein [Sphingomonas sp. NBWT7]QNE31436.1 hypothetical protein F1C10_05470 [Sphingomonas sp. NBWT7]
MGRRNGTNPADHRRSRATRAAGYIAVRALAGLALACCSVAVHRDLVFASEASFGGGWPLVFLIDRPGVSVTGRLSLIEDAFNSAAFAIDWLVWSVLFTVAAATWRRLARREDD